MLGCSPTWPPETVLGQTQTSSAHDLHLATFCCCASVCTCLDYGRCWLLRITLLLVTLLLLWVVSPLSTMSQQQLCAVSHGGTNGSSLGCQLPACAHMCSTPSAGPSLSPLLYSRGGALHDDTGCACSDPNHCLRMLWLLHVVVLRYGYACMALQIKLLHLMGC